MCHRIDLRYPHSVVLVHANERACVHLLSCFASFHWFLFESINIGSQRWGWPSPVSAAAARLPLSRGWYPCPCPVPRVQTPPRFDSDKKGFLEVGFPSSFLTPFYSSYRSLAPGLGWAFCNYYCTTIHQVVLSLSFCVLGLGRRRPGEAEARWTLHAPQAVNTITQPEL